MDPYSHSAERAQQLAWAILARAALDHRGAVAVLLAAQSPAGAADILARATPGLAVHAGADLADAHRIGARLITRGPRVAAPAHRVRRPRDRSVRAGGVVDAWRRTPRRRR